MTPSQLDFLFPFVMMFYGLVMTFLLHSAFFMNIAQHRLSPALYKQFQSHRVLGLVCLVGGGMWSLQNLWAAPF